MVQADLLDSVPETCYLSVNKYTVYQAIMRLFFTECQRMNEQLDQGSLLALLRQLFFCGGCRRRTVPCPGTACEMEESDVHS